jgi:putative Mg2+ transporter-C (MgtC) family protein
MPGEAELLLRLLLACLLGGAVGLERELTGQVAGFRTHILVALGACLFTVVSAYAFGPFFSPGAGGLRYDPTRIAAQVVTGVGFLGGGAILRSGTGIHGLTTAASLWVVAAIGLAAGAGFYGGAGLSTGLALASLWGLRRVRRRLLREMRGQIAELTVRADAEMDLGALLQAVVALDARIDRLRVDQEDGLRSVTMGLHLPVDRRPDEVVAATGAVAGVRGVEWSR